jgi:hypothetical protein
MAGLPLASAVRSLTHYNGRDLWTVQLSRAALYIGAHRGLGHSPSVPLVAVNGCAQWHG